MPQIVVDRAVEVISGIEQHSELLDDFGISAAEFRAALPLAIERIRGSMSASNSSRRQFIVDLLDHLVTSKAIAGYTQPNYGDDTVYRLEVDGAGPVAIIQKGCPDGAHSSYNWNSPEWARETYLWWLCSSQKGHPGEHVAKGINRVRKKLIDDPEQDLTGVIFHNELCGSSLRPCPKNGFSQEIKGKRVPPPCVYVMPSRQQLNSDGNWRGTRRADFPGVLLKAFSIGSGYSELFAGFVGLQQRTNGDTRIKITARFGAGRTTSYRS